MAWHASLIIGIVIRLTVIVAPLSEPHRLSLVETRRECHSTKHFLGDLLSALHLLLRSVSRLQAVG